MPIRMAVLGRVPYFLGLAEPELRDVERRMVSLSWAEGDPLYLAGDPADDLYVLAVGAVPTETRKDPFLLGPTRTYEGSAVRSMTRVIQR